MATGLGFAGVVPPQTIETRTILNGTATPILIDTGAACLASVSTPAACPAGNPNYGLQGSLDGINYSTIYKDSGGGAVAQYVFSGNSGVTFQNAMIWLDTNFSIGIRYWKLTPTGNVDADKDFIFAYVYL